MEDLEKALAIEREKNERLSEEVEELKRQLNGPVYQFECSQCKGTFESRKNLRKDRAFFCSEGCKLKAKNARDLDWWHRNRGNKKDEPLSKSSPT